LLFTQAEVNYEYNQDAQTSYNWYKTAMQTYGCAPQETLSLRSPATAPGGSNGSTTTTTPSAPTCNTSLEASYENTYNSQYQELTEQEVAEVQSLQAQIAAAGAGGSSAYDAVPSEVTQQYSSKFASIKSTLNSELISINYPTN